jgi:hypothetical protein
MEYFGEASFCEGLEWLVHVADTEANRSKGDAR